MMKKMKTYVFHAQNAIFSQYELYLMITNGSPVLIYIIILFLIKNINSIDPRKQI